LRKDVPFVWQSQQESSIKKFKEILTHQPLLQYPDFTKPFILTTDAYNYAVGAVLSQGEIGKDLPIAYASRNLNNAACNHNTTEKELLAIVYAVKYFRPYLYGQKFEIVTDHRPFVHFITINQMATFVRRIQLYNSLQTWSGKFKCRCFIPQSSNDHKFTR
jgi:hypothetical protein